MSFRKRNKIKIPISSHNSSETTSKGNKNNIPLNFDEDEIVDDFDSLPSLKLKKGARKLPPFSSSLKSQDTNSSTSSDNTSKIILEKDTYGSIYKIKANNSAVLNLEDECELNEIEQNDMDYIDDNNILSISEIDEIKKEKEKLRKKFQQKQEVEKGRPSEKDYAKLLTSEERLDLLDTYKDNGGITKANEYNDIKSTEDYTDSIADDGKLALTKNEMLLEKQNRKYLIEQAINEKEVDDDQNNWEQNIVQNGSLGSSTVKINVKARLPALWKDIEDFEGDSFIDTELAKSRIKLKTKELQRRKLQEERSGLIQKGNSIINEIME
ncbi:similar to Saccharomyces cerevisiae YKR022C NTR2 Essential protein that forms a dimer with Ntr1p [Maudiozyma saulgeensis]|uniref:Similar to Saccharomyces cerevisiae YKR022C NTR2 Essential protein that forms a dimer with Ntr1p n=1 Tax=Maudiozyma saulgeensis TaxID=1789683 RepID=A0A1X7R0R7_9SACH|nr:similar to Saccharomyces cerevisiae YKR022C NTR2 Essential protein that forms a dimer with Ntr1p [Kazachstania saulgeensis]